MSIKDKNIVEMRDGSGVSLVVAESNPPSPNCGFNDARETEYIAQKTRE